jgi:hypothetical protein
MFSVQRFIALYSLFNLGMAIAETAILDNNTGAKSACGSKVWYNVLTMCLIRWFFICYSYTKAKNLEEIVGENATIHLIWIWTVVSYFTMSSDCKTFFEDNYMPLIDVMLAETVVFFIVMTFSLLVAIRAWYERNQHNNTTNPQTVIHSTHHIDDNHSRMIGYLNREANQNNQVHVQTQPSAPANNIPPPPYNSFTGNTG